MKKWLKDIFKKCRDTFQEKDKAVFLTMILLLAGEMAALFWNSGSVRGMNTRADAYKEAAVAEADAATIAAGDIYDRNNTLLVENKSPDKASVYIDGWNYSQVIGYSEKETVTYGEKINRERQHYRLMEYYEDYLYKTTNVDGTKGCSLTLTLDHQLQEKTATLLSQEMDPEDRGSVIVMDAQTGEILSMVALPAFDANNLDVSLDKMRQEPKEKEIYYPITHKGRVVPGSIFKVITSVALIDNGMEGFTAQDIDFMVERAKVTNSYRASGDIIDFKQGIERSSNVFFAKAGLMLGADKIEETAKRFMIGESVELDFGSIESYWDLNKNNSSELAYTSFGQGKTLFSTIYGVMMAEAIANDGDMMKPYMIREIKDADGNVVLRGKGQILSHVTGKETADKVTDAMLAATRSHMVAVSEKNRKIYEKYSIASKTGTGENGDEEETNSAWLISFAPADNPQYVVVANQCRTQKYGQNLMDMTAEIYRYLFER